MFLQDSPHCLLPLHLLLPPQVENQKGQKNEEEHHSTYCSCDGCTRSKQKEIVPQNHSIWLNLMEVEFLSEKCC